MLHYLPKVNKNSTKNCFIT